MKENVEKIKPNGTLEGNIFLLIRSNKLNCRPTSSPEKQGETLHVHVGLSSPLHFALQVTGSETGEVRVRHDLQWVQLKTFSSWVFFNHILPQPGLSMRVGAEPGVSDRTLSTSSCC